MYPPKYSYGMRSIFALVAINTLYVVAFFCKKDSVTEIFKKDYDN